MTAEQPIGVFIVDDHALFRDGVTAMLQTDDRISVRGDAPSGRAALEIITQLNERAKVVDVVVTDLEMEDGDGHWLCRQLARLARRPKVIVMTSFVGDFDVLSAMESGAEGYLTKRCGGSSLLTAVHQVVGGQQYVDERVVATMAGLFDRQTLTQRERDILTLVADGMANKQIAARLSITEGTVKTHMNNIMGKLGAEGRTGAVVTALKRGILRLKKS